MTDDEIKIYYLLNEERKRASLEPLALDIRLTASARKKNENIINEGVGHGSQDIRFIGFIREVTGKDYRRFGEITAMGHKIENIIESFKKCSGERNYIFDPMYTHMGVAVLNHYSKTIVVTVHFGSKN